jgi:glycerol-3-phosphate acyltransferase PlsY
VIIPILLGVAAYLIGSIPFGYVLVYMLRGIDVRTVGSKNLGATNVARALGTPWFAVCFAFDFGKGFVPAYVLGGVAVREFDAAPEVAVAYGVAAMAGHIWPVYLKFKGGKGVATAAGAVTGIAPAALGVAAVVFVITLLIGRMVSLGSILATASLSVGYLVLEGKEASQIVTAAFAFMFLLVLWKHRTNIGRIARGEEPKVFGKKKKAEASDA